MLKSALDQSGLYKLRGATYNEIVKRIRDLEGQKKSDSDFGPAHPPGVMDVYNVSGVDFDEYQVVALSDPIPLPPSDSFEHDNAFDFIAPNIASHRGSFGVLQNACLDLNSAPARFQGVTRVNLDVVNENHVLADIGDDQTELKTTAFGSARILWKEAGTGSGKKAKVLLGQEMPFIARGTTAEEIAADASGLVNLVLTPEQVTAVNDWGPAPATIPISTEVFVVLTLPNTFTILSLSAAGAGGGGSFGKVLGLTGSYDPLGAGPLIVGSFQPIDVSGTPVGAPLNFYSTFTADIPDATFALFGRFDDGNYYILNSIC